MQFVKAALFACAVMFAAAAGAAQDTGYTNTALNLEGIGKAYMGREIAHVMGYEGADWLERDTRVKEEGSDKLLPLLNLKPTDVVADIGAGTGYFSFRISPLVPQGKVYAEDIQKEMLDVINARKAKGEGKNVIPTLGGVTDPRLPPNSIDLVLLVDVYHEFSYPREMGQAIMRALKPGGRVALVEYRGEDPKIQIKDLHKMTEAQARKEFAAVGFQWVSTDSTSLPIQHLIIFAKPK